MGLELAEIEGDALFLYKLEDNIDINLIKQQIEDMYLAFHKHLKRYELQRICNCGACSSAYNLSLKFVVHYGEIEFIKVKTSKKPYGSNVIKVYRRRQERAVSPTQFPPPARSVRRPSTGARPGLRPA